MKPFFQSIPLTYIRTAWPEDYISVQFLKDMGIKRTNILWEYEGQFSLIPSPHVDNKLLENEKTPQPVHITLEGAGLVDYELARQLTRRSK